MSTITKLSQDVTQYYKNITSPIGANCENIKRYTIMNNTKDAHELQKKNSRDEQGGPGRIGSRTDLPLIHYASVVSH